MSVTVTELITRIRKQADSPGSSTSGFYTDSQILSDLNSEWGELYDFLVKKKQALFVTKTSGSDLITLVSGTAEYSLPSTDPAIKRLEGVEVLFSGDSAYRTLGAINWEERNQWVDTDYATFSGNPIGYILVGSKLVFSPTPSRSGSVRLWYIPQAAELVESGATGSQITSLPSVIEPGWEQVLIDGCASKIWIGQQDVQMATHFANLKTMKKKEIGEAFSPRDGNRPAEVQLVRRPRRF